MTNDPLKASLSVVMPVFNEEKSLSATLARTVASLKALGIHHEIVIVNDASRDNTAAVAQALTREYRQVRLVHHHVNQGIGRAFRTGVESATLEYVILIPADNPPMPEDLAPFIGPMGTFDIIAGVRERREGYTPLLAFLSYAYNRVFIPLLFQLNLKDVNWIQAYRRRIFTEGGIVIEHPGIFFFVEVLVKARRLGFTVTEVPSRMKKRLYGRPTISRFPVVARIFRDAVVFFFSLHFSAKGKVPRP
ncbi:MAG: glycosyltransferase family 2 protein [Candidatus Omnitrophica bacterium]|nr:glycosyltransferase family 2 protein [Candidatus Omnitrophota bacterium]